MQKGRYREAIVSFERARDLDPKAPEPYLRLALIYEECLRDPAAALQYYRTYEQVETDEVRREEVQGWILELEREIGDEGEGEGHSLSPAGTPPVAGSDSPKHPHVPVVNPVEESPKYRDLQAKLASALAEIRALRARGVAEPGPAANRPEQDPRVQELESENKLLQESLEKAETDVLRSRQAAAQAEKRRDKLQTAYEAQVAELRGQLALAEEKLREARAAHARRQTAVSTESEEVARLRKTVKSYEATLSTLQKVNDELKKENASLRSQLSTKGGGGVRYYRVREGETLRKIAGYSFVYGDSRKWVLIYEANRGKVRDPNSLTPGQVLVIPPD